MPFNSFWEPGIPGNGAVNRCTGVEKAGDLGGVNSSILGGPIAFPLGTHINCADVSTIVMGCNNTINRLSAGTPGCLNTILNGCLNTLSGYTNSIFGGRDNEIPSGTYNVIGGGCANAICNASCFNTRLAG